MEDYKSAFIAPITPCIWPLSYRWKKEYYCSCSSNVTSCLTYSSVVKRMYFAVTALIQPVTRLVWNVVLSHLFSPKKELYKLLLKELYFSLKSKDYKWKPYYIAVTSIFHTAVAAIPAHVTQSPKLQVFYLVIAVTAQSGVIKKDKHSSCSINPRTHT